MLESSTLSSVAVLKATRRLSTLHHRPNVVHIYQMFVIVESVLERQNTMKMKRLLLLQIELAMSHTIKVNEKRKDFCSSWPRKRHL